MTYQHNLIEPKWQQAWQRARLFAAHEDSTKKKFYALDMFPYPSAAGLHVGHVLGYTATDIVSRFYRMNGYSVLHPMGWDAFGLPAEQHAIETGEHPAALTFRNIDNFKNQLQRLGMAYDWDREVFTCKPDFYKGTQQIFRLLYERGLAYQAEIPVNWCPALKTVLANEEVVDGKSERGGHDVIRVPMKQWMLRITAYAERLLEGLERIDWPESVKDIQRNWIGRSVGARITFAVKGVADAGVEVFTTRADTLFGATYMVLAPEHPLVDRITTAAQRPAVTEFRAAAAKKSDLDRTELNKEKNGVFTGAFAIHPVTGQDVPIYLSDYVLMTYGTGAITAVPAHDTRDFEFATKYQLPIVEVVRVRDLAPGAQAELPFTGDGVLVNSGFLDGLSVPEAKTKMADFLKEKGVGEATVTYKLRDWLFSRQRYWGEPIPVLKDGHGRVVRPLRDDELPLTLPEVKSYEPTDDGKSPIAALESWVRQTGEGGAPLFRETDTMPGSAGSSWYFLRYCDPKNALIPFDYQKAKYWMPVDLYIGGQEHAVGHLMYSRFWTKVLYDAGLCPVDEPFQRLVNQGMICRFGAKMSKSKGNGVNPDEVIQTYGADALRMYEMFMGPLTQTKEWDDQNLAGVHRFLARVERAFVNDRDESLLNDAPPTPKDVKALHKTIKSITHDIQEMTFNKCVSQMMIFMNTIYETGTRNRTLLGEFLKLLSPFAPHLAEELWHKCILEGRKHPDESDYPFVSVAGWPKWDEALTVDDDVTIGVQVGGKHRGEITIPKDAPQDVAVAAAKEHAIIGPFLDGKEMVKVVYVANRILNFVVKG